MKIRTDFITNSSSSSFILAFKDKKEAYSKICEAFLNVRLKQNDNWEDDYFDAYDDDFSFDENACALDNIILAMEQNKKTIEQIIENYLEEISWYPVRHKIEREFWNNPEKYPRKDSADFRAKYDAMINKLRDEELAKIRTDLEKWFSDKTYIAKVEFEDHWPESKAYDVCASLSEENMKSVRH